MSEWDCVSERVFEYKCEHPKPNRRAYLSNNSCSFGPIYHGVCFVLFCMCFLLGRLGAPALKVFAALEEAQQRGVLKVPIDDSLRFAEQGAPSLSLVGWTNNYHVRKFLKNISLFALLIISISGDSFGDAGHSQGYSPVPQINGKYYWYGTDALRYLHRRRPFSSLSLE